MRCTSDGKPAIKALSWRQIDRIRARFASLNPYAQDAVPGSILELEAENYSGKRRRQLWCYAISAKALAWAYPEASGRIRL